MITFMVERMEIPATDDLALARNAVADKDAFAELYRRHSKRVYRYHIARTGNSKDAEDLTSQTFISALEGLKSFRGDSSFAAWILGIASKKRLMFFRGRKPDIPLDDALHLPSPGLPTDREAHQRLTLQAIARALKTIPADRAEAVVLSYFGGLSNQEIAAALRKSEAAAKMLVSRGLQDLRERTSLEMEVEL